MCVCVANVPWWRKAFTSRPYGRFENRLRAPINRASDSLFYLIYYCFPVLYGTEDREVQHIANAQHFDPTEFMDYCRRALCDDHCEHEWALPYPPESENETARKARRRGWEQRGKEGKREKERESAPKFPHLEIIDFWNTILRVMETETDFISENGCGILHLCSVCVYGVHVPEFACVFELSHVCHVIQFN